MVKINKKLLSLMLISALNTTTVVASSNIDDEGDASNQEQDREENTKTQRFLAFLKDWQVIPSALLSGILIRSLIGNKTEEQKKSRSEEKEASSRTQKTLKHIMRQCSRFNRHLLSELEHNEDAKKVVPEVLKLYTNHNAKKPAAKGNSAAITQDEINKAFQKDVINWLKKHEKNLFQTNLALQTASFDKHEKAFTEYNEAINNVNKILSFAAPEHDKGSTEMGDDSDEEKTAPSDRNSEKKRLFANEQSYPYSRD